MKNTYKVTSLSPYILRGGDGSAKGGGVINILHLVKCWYGLQLIFHAQTIFVFDVRPYAIMLKCVPQ